MNIIQTEKFSDTYILIRTMMPLCKEDVTKMNLLVYMMRAKTKKYDTKQKLSMALNATYGMHVSYGLSGYGRQVAFDVRFKYIREDFIQKEGYLDNVIDIMDQVLYEPVLDESTLKEAKYLLKSKLMSQKDDPDSIAIKNALIHAAKDHEIGIQIQGYLEDLDTITLDDMKALHAQFLECKKTVFGCGHVCHEMEDFLDRISQAETIENVYSLISKQAPQYVLERKDISQASLVQVYATSTSWSDDLYYALLVMNAMLGQCPMNLLFEEIREKNSYCYSITSSLIRFDGALVIMAGTNGENLDSVQALIQEQIVRLQKGDVEDSLMAIAKSDLVDMIHSQQDQANSMIEQKFLDMLLNRDEQSEDRIQKILDVTMEDVQNVAARLSLVSVSIVEEMHDEI